MLGTADVLTSEDVPKIPSHFFPLIAQLTGRHALAHPRLVVLNPADSLAFVTFPSKLSPE